MAMHYCKGVFTIECPREESSWNPYEKGRCWNCQETFDALARIKKQGQWNNFDGDIIHKELMRLLKEGRVVEVINTEDAPDVVGVIATREGALDFACGIAQGADEVAWKKFDSDYKEPLVLIDAWWD